jgi:GNAT superfamily N-acetyltransferase
MIGKNTSADLIQTPDQCSPEQLNAFAEVVLEGRQIRATGLRERLAQAHWLGFHFENGEVAAVAALKRPGAKYRAKVFERAEATLQSGDFLADLGWVFTREKFRGRGISRRLLERLLEQAGKANLFATTRTDNVPMQALLELLGFRQEGRTFVSARGNYLLQLWVRFLA